MQLRACEMEYSTIKVSGKTLELARCGSPEYSPTVVLLHEALGSVRHWRDFPVQLANAARCNTVLYSRVGHGDSEGPVEKRSFEYMERQGGVVRSVLDALHIDRPFLFGHSEGAIIGLFFASAHPRIARGLILESPVVQVERATVSGMRKAEEAYRTTDLKAKLQRYHRDADAVFSAFADPWLAEGTTAHGLEERLRRITTPTLVLQGDRDEYSTVRQSEILTQFIPDSQAVLIPNCGHTPHREQVQAVLDRVSAFIAAVR